MTRASVLPLVLALLAAFTPAAGAAQPAATAVSAWIAEPAPDATGASAYVELNNPTMYDVYVVSATAAAVAAKVELRAGLAPGAAPTPVKEFPIPAYGSTEAAASSPHLRLVDLKRPLKAGEMVELVLTTNDGTVLKVAAVVRKP
jgi:periplasmic copper chaperone A